MGSFFFPARLRLPFLLLAHEGVFGGLITSPILTRYSAIHRSAIVCNCDPRERYYSRENRPNVPDDYSAQQLTTNRIRECAVANKVELMRIIRSGECFSRSGKRRMDSIVDQLVVACPLADPASSTLLDGKWVKQGVIGRQTHIVDINTPIVLEGKREPTIMTYNWLLSGFLAVSRRLAVRDIKGDTVNFISRGARVSICGSLNFKLPRRPGAGISKMRILYLDSDLQVLAMDRNGEEAPPEVFVKPKGFNEQVELRARKNANSRSVLLHMMQSVLRFIANPFKTRSPFRFRDRAAGVFLDAADDVSSVSKALKSGGSQRSGPGGTGSGGGLIGEIDSLASSDSPWATEEDMLQQLSMDGVESSFVVGDLLNGKVTRKLKGGS